MGNISMIDTPIFFVIRMYIRQTNQLEDGETNTKYNKDGKFHSKSINLNLDDNTKIKKTIAVNKNNEDEKENLREKNRQKKREKQR